MEKVRENIIDLSAISSPENFLFELTGIIEKENFQGKTVKINFGNVVISQDYLLSMLSVLKSYGTEVEMVYASSKETRFSAIEAGLTVSGQALETGFSSASPENTDENKLESILENGAQTGQDSTLLVKQTLRSGQKLEYDGNIVIIGDCNGGSEVIAGGDIIIWGVLSGIAHAGNRGNTKACIRAFKINAIQLRIADLLARKPDTAEIEKVEKYESFNPEEARISEGEIMIYSLNQSTD